MHDRMCRAQLGKALFCSTVLALLALRLVTPAGYMPASAGSGLLFELCPDGIPVAVINAIAGSEHHHHHHRSGHGNDDDSEPASAIDQCPIGHMLSSSITSEDTGVLQLFLAPVSFRVVSVRSLQVASRTQYLSRGPPT